MTHICVSKLTIIGSDNGLSPGRRQAIIWTNAGILLIRPLGTNSSEILIEICTFSFNTFENGVCEMASILSRPQWVNCLSPLWCHCWSHDHQCLFDCYKVSTTLLAATPFFCDLITTFKLCWAFVSAVITLLGNSLIFFFSQTDWLLSLGSLPGIW